MSVPAPPRDFIDDIAGIVDDIGIVAGAADHPVRAGAAVEEVGERVAGERVGEGRAGEVLEVLEDIAGGIAGADLRRCQQQADLHAGAGTGIGDRIGARPAIERVGASAALDQIVARVA